MKRNIQIGVVGSAGPEEYSFKKPNVAMYKVAESVGGLLAKKGCIVVNGGKGGIMESVCKGCKAAGGITVAETAGIERLTSNKYVDIEIVTGSINMSGACTLVGMSDAVIALGGGAGTLQELCVAYRLGKPIVLIKGYGGWSDILSGMGYFDERKSVKFLVAETPELAVELALKSVTRRTS